MLKRIVFLAKRIVQKTIKLLSFQNQRMGSDVGFSNNVGVNTYVKECKMSKFNERVNTDSEKVKVILREGSASSFKQCHRIFYNKKMHPLESLLVHPVGQSVRFFKVKGRESIT